MKKIICLVLSLIMSLSCLTVAFGAATEITPDAITFQQETGTTYAHWTIKDVDGCFIETTDTANATYVVKDPTATATDIYLIEADVNINGTIYDIYSAVTGKLMGPIALESKPMVKNSDGSGEVAHFVDGYGTRYMIVNDSEDADYVLNYANSKTMFRYVKVVEDVAYVSKATEFTNFGTNCGQINKTISNVKYYTWTYKDAVYYGQGVESGASHYVLVNDEIVGVVLVDINRHNFYVAVRVDGVATEVKCAVCGMIGTPVKNAISVPAGKDYVPMIDLGGGYSGVYFDKFNIPTAPDKKPVQDAVIESPQTFDTGIAGYVALTLASTTGMAWVAKKKEN